MSAAFSRTKKGSVPVFPLIDPDPFLFVRGGDVTRTIKSLDDDPKVATTKTRWSGWTLLHRAAEQGQTDICQVLLEQGANVNEKTIWGWYTPLHLALANGWKETAVYLVTMGANPEAKSKCGRNPAVYGAYRGYRQLAEEFRLHLRHKQELEAAELAKKEREKLKGKNFFEQLL